eukprot:c5279_g1_i1 orf=79-261(+)
MGLEVETDSTSSMFNCLGEESQHGNSILWLQRHHCKLSQNARKLRRKESILSKQGGLHRR